MAKLSKRGVAMELALITLLDIFFLCFMLLSVAEVSSAYRTKISKEINGRTDIWQIGDLFVLECSEGNYSGFAEQEFGDFTARPDTFTDESGTYYSVAVSRSDGKAESLYLCCDGEGNVLASFRNIGSYNSFWTSLKSGGAGNPAQSEPDPGQPDPGPDEPGTSETTQEEATSSDPTGTTAQDPAETTAQDPAETTAQNPAETTASDTVETTAPATEETMGSSTEETTKLVPDEPGEPETPSPDPDVPGNG